MIADFENVKRELKELAEILNTFKSEAVQLRILESLLGTQSSGTGKSVDSLGVGTSESDQSDTAPPKKKPTKKKSTVNKSPESKASARRSAGNEPNAILSELASGTFFDQPRTIRDIVEHCKHNLARSIKPNEISGKLARMVRDGNLSRTKNSDNQYEYTKP